MPSSSQPAMPSTSQTPVSETNEGAGRPDQKKRKARVLAAPTGPSKSHAGRSSSPMAARSSASLQSSSRPASISGTHRGRTLQGARRPIDEDEEVEDNAPEEDSQDELYCQLKTNIVGIQYYKGKQIF
jgi:SWI/SNF-related matrix-associated actin-dependent regulator of chromatin subfamily A3